MTKGKTIATLVRNELGLLSLKGKKTWSETGRGGMIAQTQNKLLGECNAFLEGLGFVLEHKTDKVEVWAIGGERKEATPWGATKARLHIMSWDGGATAVEISYLLAMRDWHEEQGIPC